MHVRLARKTKSVVTVVGVACPLAEARFVLLLVAAQTTARQVGPAGAAPAHRLASSASDAVSMDALTAKSAIQALDSAPQLSPNVTPANTTGSAAQVEHVTALAQASASVFHDAPEAQLAPEHQHASTTLTPDTKYASLKERHAALTRTLRTAPIPATNATQHVEAVRPSVS